MTKNVLRRFLMVRCHLARLMGERKMKIVDVARETGLNRNTITLLYKETAQRIELDALDKLCKLFNCGVGDLLEFDDEREK
tara:strand:- start:176 stop:418 length:243 start_codon:yes stop_codon:yes gene_type:complete